jgi:hypothetical protein
MKKTIYFLFILTLSLVTSCDYYEGDTFDFSNTLPNYVELKSKAVIEVEPEGTADFTIQVRQAYTVPVNVTYQITGPAINTTVTVTLPKLTLELPQSFLIPADAEEGDKYTVSLINAESEQPVQVGRLSKDKEKETFEVVFPEEEEE